MPPPMASCPTCSINAPPAARRQATSRQPPPQAAPRRELRRQGSGPPLPRPAAAGFGGRLAGWRRPPERRRSCCTSTLRPWPLLGAPAGAAALPGEGRGCHMSDAAGDCPSMRGSQAQHAPATDQRSAAAAARSAAAAPRPGAIGSIGDVRRAEQGGTSAEQLGGCWFKSGARPRGWAPCHKLWISPGPKCARDRGVWASAPPKAPARHSMA